MKSTKLFAAFSLSLAAGLAFGPSVSSAQDAATRQVGDFKEGSIKGLPGVLPLNIVTIAALGNTPDSQLHALTMSVFNDYRNAATNGPGLTNQNFGVVTRNTLAKLFPTPEQLVAIQRTNDDRAKPLWAQGESDTYPQLVDGKFILKPTPTRVARFDFSRAIYRAAQSDVRAAKEYALILDTWANRQQLVNGQGYSQSGQLDLRWSQVEQNATNRLILGGDAQVGRCVPIKVGGTSDAMAQITGEGDAEQVCLAFNNLRGVAIPTAIKVRDTSQFKPKDDLRVAVVFTLQTPVVTKSRVDSNAVSSIIDAKVSYLQIVEVNSMTALGPRIPMDVKSPDLVYLEAKECLMLLKSNRGFPYEVGATKCGLSKEEAAAAFR